MMSPKSIARWQELKAKKLSGRTVPEDMEYKKLQMKHDADVLALNELKWKAELAEAMLTLASNNDDLMQRLNNIIDSQIGDKQKPFAKKEGQSQIVLMATYEHHWKVMLQIVDKRPILAKPELVFRKPLSKFIDKTSFAMVQRECSKNTTRDVAASNWDESMGLGPLEPVS